MTVRITLELDIDSYNKKYGPGSEWQKKYYPEGTPDDHWLKKPDWLKEMVKDILEEGFHDWASQGWMKVQVQQG
jgi:hypothetical protein